jgi:hypothetical protein
VANSVAKNAEKGVAGIVVTGIAAIVAEIAVSVGVPADAKPYITATVAGGLFAAWNWLKHRGR